MIVLKVDSKKGFHLIDINSSVESIQQELGNKNITSNSIVIGNKHFVIIFNKDDIYDLHNTAIGFIENTNNIRILTKPYLIASFSKNNYKELGKSDITALMERYLKIKAKKDEFGAALNLTHYNNDKLFKELNYNLLKK